MPAAPPVRAVPRDGALLLFDRRDGTNVLVRGPSTRQLRARAPRTVMFAPTNACNLRCDFCSRDASAPSRWDEASAFELLAGLARSGALEVALGGGEPLAFRGLDALLERLAAETSLAVHLTTNGVLLDERRLARLRAHVGEIRISIYDEQPWPARVAMLAEAGGAFGANVLLTRERVSALPALLARLEALGCPDVALLRYVGPDPALALDPISLARVAEHARRTSMRVRASVCFGTELALPTLRAGSTGDCGAGSDFVVVGSDRTVRACSFASAAIPFTTAADVVAIWQRKRARLDARVDSHGCARRAANEPVLADADGVRIWRAFSSNNSGDCFLVGKFERAADAHAFVESLRDGYAPGEPFSPAWRELLEREGIAVRADEHMPDRLDAIGRTVLAHTDSAVDDDFPALRTRVWRAGGRPVGGAVHEHAQVHLLTALAFDDARLIDDVEVRNAIDDIGAFVRHGDVLYGIHASPSPADEALARLRDSIAAGAMASAELVAGEAPPLASAIAAKLSDVEMEWLRVHARDAESAAQLARDLGPNAASGGRLVLLRAPRIGKRAGAHASSVAEGATILVGEELRLEAAYWSRRGRVEDLAPDDVERELRAELAGAARLDGPVEVHWASMVVKLTTRTPLRILPILAALASSRRLEIHIEAQPTRPFGRALGRLDVDVRALRRERRSR